MQKSPGESPPRPREDAVRKEKCREDGKKFTTRPTMPAWNPRPMAAGRERSAATTPVGLARRAARILAADERHSAARLPHRLHPDRDPEVVLDSLEAPNRWMCSLFLHMMDWGGVELDSCGDSKERLPGIV
jgi:hypothetical protein